MRRRDSIQIFIILSLILHILILGWGVTKAPSLLEGKKPPREAIEVTLLKDHPYQIADIAPPEKEERPDDAKFVGLYDSRVEEEQVAPSRMPSSSSKSGEPGRKSPKKGAAPDDAPRKTTKETKKKEGRGEIAMKPPEREELPAFPEAGGGDGVLEALPEDFFPDYKVGNKTYLNVLRFPKVGYFVRLKKIFRTTFNPVPSIRGSVMTNQVSKGQIEVSLGVAVDTSGNLAELFVINSSGLPLYDKEAMRTIKDSSPFAAPPKELLNDSGRLLRMVWTFTVYL